MRWIILVLTLFISSPVFAEMSFNFKLDHQSKNIKAYGREADLSWRAMEVEIENTFAKDKLRFLSGFAVGFRMEGQESAYNGNYFVFRFFHKKPLNWQKTELRTSVAFVYGTPGTLYQKSWPDSDGTNLRSYTNLYLVRNISIPGGEVKDMGVLYPEISVSLRKTLWKLHAEPVIGIRFMKFGKTYSNFVSVKNEENLVFVPTVGIKIGYSF